MRRILRMLVMFTVLAPGVQGQQQPAPALPCQDCCPKPPCEIEPPPGQLPALRGVFYYPWWDGWDASRQKANPKWSECIKVNQSNPQLDACGRPMVSDAEYWSTRVYLQPDIDSNGVFQPYTDLYDDRNGAVQTLQFSRMRQEWVNLAIYSWWGDRCISPSPNCKFYQTLQRAVGYVGVSPYLERRYRRSRDETDWVCDYGREDCVRDNILWDVDNLVKYFVNTGAFYWMGDQNPRPVFFAYIGSIRTCTDVGYLKQALDYVQANYGVRPFVFLDMGGDVTPSCSYATPNDFAFHVYDPNRANGTHTDYYGEAKRGSTIESITVRAGFFRCRCTDDQITHGRCNMNYYPCKAFSNMNEVKSVSAFQQALATAMSKNPKYFVLITSWNEWLEGTPVEPGVQWWSPSGLGMFGDVMQTLRP
jgi:hypothetical protein